MFITKTAHTKIEGSQINSLAMHIKVLERQQKANLKRVE
jgi:hypothetical protein